MGVSTTVPVATTVNPAKFLELRRSKHLSQRAFAERVDYSYSQVKQVETGQIAPSLKYCRAVCEAFNVDIRYLFAR